MSNPQLNGIGPDVKLATGLLPLNRAGATSQGTGVDRLGFNSVVIEAMAGTEEGSPSARTWDVSLEHSDASGSGYVALTGSAVTQFTAASGRKRKSISLKGAKRYIRVASVLAFTGGTTPKLNTSVSLVLGGAVELPAQADD